MSLLPLFVLPALGASAGVVAWGAVSSSSQLFGPTLHDTPDASLIALTFDDGPNPAQTPQLLKLLERHGAPATFFLVGRFALKCAGLVREIADRGHSIGNHTQSHPNLAWMSSRQIAGELRACQDSILGALGSECEAAPVMMRPPFGYRGPQLWSAVRAAGLRGVVMWSTKCYDWKPQPAHRLIKRLERVAERNRIDPVTTGGKLAEKGPGAHAGHIANGRSPRGEIIVMHDGDARELGADRSHVLAALEYWLPRWRDMGFEFVTINRFVSGLPSAQMGP